MPAGPPPAITQRVCSFSGMRFQSNTTQIKMKANIPENAQDRAAFTYNAAADCFDASPLSFWDYFGRRTIELALLPIGSRVLDVCCGTGASALPAAEAVGPKGHVIGVDLAKQLLELARTKAIQRNLGNIEFEVGDMLSMRFPVASFDAVVCVFGIFFVPDMARAVSELWSRVRPGGKLAVTTWGPNFCQPATDAFWCSIKEYGLICTKASIHGIESIIQQAWQRFSTRVGSHHQKSFLKIASTSLSRLTIGGRLS